MHVIENLPHNNQKASAINKQKKLYDSPKKSK